MVRICLPVGLYPGLVRTILSWWGPDFEIHEILKDATYPACDFSVCGGVAKELRDRNVVFFATWAAVGSVKSWAMRRLPYSSLGIVFRVEMFRDVGEGNGWLYPSDGGMVGFKRPPLAGMTASLV